MNRRWPTWRYVRLRHRIFAAITLSIVVTAVCVGVAVHGLGWDGYRSQLAAAGKFVSARFAEAWSNPERLSQLASEVESSSNAVLVLFDDKGQPVYGHSQACPRPDLRLAINDSSGQIGSLALCWRYSPRPGVVAIVGLVVGATLLWFFSGKLAWRMARPVDELLRVAREIGEGNLAARMRLRRHHRDEVGEIAEAVNEMAVRIERQLSGQRELLAAVSHEIRTPLARLRVLVELERSNPGDSKRLDSIEAELVEIDSLVGQLLAQSKLDFSALDRRRLSPAELGRVALERAGLSERLLNDTSHEAMIMADPSLIARALANLIDNAERHGNGLTELAVYREQQWLIMAVHDKGAGIASEILPRLFAPFERTGKNAGLGLGLALVERIARAHGGSAFATSRQSGGAAVGFRIALSS